MRLVLAGQKSFGAAVLAALLNRRPEHEVVRVFAPLDDRLDFDARAVGLPVLDKASARDMPECDLIVCAHSHTFLSDAAILRARYGAIGYHPSLLPRHRGRDAVRWTVHMGDPVAGGSVYWFTGRVDGGPLAAQDYVLVKPGWTHNDLWRDALFPMGVRLLLKVIDDVSRGTIVREPQDEECATWEPSWDRPPLHRPDLIQLPGPDSDRVRYVTSMREANR
jgi:methionyl-tRNA formyltransferase